MIKVFFCKKMDMIKLYRRCEIIEGNKETTVEFIFYNNWGIWRLSTYQYSSSIWFSSSYLIVSLSLSGYCRCYQINDKLICLPYYNILFNSMSISKHHIYIYLTIIVNLWCWVENDTLNIIFITIQCFFFFWTL